MGYRRWASWHRYLGLALAAHWLLLAITGILLVFHRDIEQAALSSGQDPQTQSLDAVAGAIVRLRPDCVIDRMTTLNGGIGLLRIKAQCSGEERSLVFDTGVMQVVGDSPATGSFRADGFFQSVYQLHQMLLLGADGKTPVALSGLAMVTIALIGYVLVWPQRGRLKSLIWPKTVGNGRSRMIQLHRALGIILGPFLILAALTGAGMNWTPALAGVMEKIGMAAPPAAVAPQANAVGPVSADGALAIARARFPDANFTSVAMPQDPNGQFLVRLRQSGEAHQTFGLTAIAVEANSGDITSVHDPRNAPIGNVALEWLFALHNGEILGIVGRMLVLALGCALIAITWMAVLAWSRTRKPAKLAANLRRREKAIDSHG